MELSPTFRHFIWTIIVRLAGEDTKVVVAFVWVPLVVPFVHVGIAGAVRVFQTLHTFVGGVGVADCRRAA